MLGSQFGKGNGYFKRRPDRAEDNAGNGFPGFGVVVETPEFDDALTISLVSVNQMLTYSIVHFIAPCCLADDKSYHVPGKSQVVARFLSSLAFADFDSLSECAFFSFSVLFARPDAMSAFRRFISFGVRFAQAVFAAFD